MDNLDSRWKLTTINFQILHLGRQYNLRALRWNDTGLF